MPLTVLETALAATKAGIVAVPVREDGSKMPDLPTWKELQERQPTREELRAWFKERPDRQGLGFITGAISGGLELLEFDDRDAILKFKAACVEHGLYELYQRIELGYCEETPGGGIHLLYRVAVPGVPLKNTKLARKACPGAPACTKPTHVAGKPHVLIETRGEGGFVVVAPSAGSVHETGGAYVLRSQGIEHIAALTEEERDALFALAQTFDELPREAERGPRPIMRDEGLIGDRPGDAWARHTPWAAILEPAGWHFVKRIGALEYWRRPGKNRGQHSATAGPRGGDANADYLYPFTTSTEFDSERGYSKFAVYTILNNGTDAAAYAKSARELRQQGFGGEDDIDAMLPDSGPLTGAGAPDRAGEAVASAPVPIREPLEEPYRFEHIFPPGHFVHDWIAHCSARVDAAYEYHEAGALILLAAATAGMKADNLKPWPPPRGLRTNLYIVLIGDTSVSRKSTAISLVELALLQLGLQDNLLADQGSAEGFIEQISERSRSTGADASLWLVTEFGQMFEDLENKIAERGRKRVLLDVYDGKSYQHRRTNKRVKGEAGLSPDSIVIADPYMSILGGSTADILEAMSSRDVESGLLPRFAYVWPESKPPYMDIDEIADGETEGFSKLVERLQSIRDACGSSLRVRFTADARRALNAFGREIEQEASHRHILARLGPMAWKVAMLSAASELDTVRPANSTLNVEAMHAQQGVALATKWRGYALRFGMGIGGQTPDERRFSSKADRVIEWLMEHGPDALRRDVMRAMHLSAKAADELQATLVRQGRLRAYESPVEPSNSGPNQRGPVHWQLEA